MATKLIQAPTYPEAPLDQKLQVLAQALQLLIRNAGLEESEEYDQLTELFGQFSSSTWIGSEE